MDTLLFTWGDLSELALWAIDWKQGEPIKELEPLNEESPCPFHEDEALQYLLAKSPNTFARNSEDVEFTPSSGNRLASLVRRVFLV